MGILFRRTSVRGPARVTDAPTAFQRLHTDHFFKIAQLAFSPPNLDGPATAIAAHSDPGRVIPAIFQRSEPVNNDGNNTFLAYVTYDSAHNLKILSTDDASTCTSQCRNSAPLISCHPERHRATKERGRVEGPLGFGFALYRFREFSPEPISPTCTPIATSATNWTQRLSRGFCLFYSGTESALVTSVYLARG